VKAPSLPHRDVDDLVSAEITAVVREFNNVVVGVRSPGSQLSGAQSGPGPSRSVQVAVRAVYYVNLPLARSHYAAARRQDLLSQGQDEFGALVAALRGRPSLLESADDGRRYSAGRAVEVGKATAEDVGWFVNEALDRGVVARYALQEGRLPAGRQLTDLSPQALIEAVQGWINATGVGVDCSGLALQAAIRAREAVRQLAADRGVQGPRQISHRERDAASFARGPVVTAASDLHPGDAWVLRGGEHVRMVSAVRQLANQVEFESVESSGTETRPTPGPVKRTWRSHSLAGIHPIVLWAGPEPGRAEGSFHRT
jgi:hypothetical protein